VKKFLKKRKLVEETDQAILMNRLEVESTANFSKNHKPFTQDGGKGSQKWMGKKRKRNMGQKKGYKWCSVRLYRPALLPTRGKGEGGRKA